MTPLTKSDRIINIIVSVLFVFVLFITVDYRKLFGAVKRKAVVG